MEASHGNFVPKCGVCNGPMVLQRPIGSAIARIIIGMALLAVGVTFYGVIGDRTSADMFEPRILALTWLPSVAGGVLLVFGLMTLNKRALKCSACGGTVPGRGTP